MQIEISEENLARIDKVKEILKERISVSYDASITSLANMFLADGLNTFIASEKKVKTRNEL